MKVSTGLLAGRAAVVLLLALGCASAPKPVPGPLPAPEPATVGGTYRVGPADQLVIRVLPEPAIERTVKVGPDGRFSVDLIGDVDAAGKTLDEISRDIQTRMAKYRQAPSVTVSLVLPSSVTVSILGEVNKPISLVIERPIRVSEAMSLAGGPTHLAATSRLRVIRRQGNEAVVYLSNLDAIQAGQTETDVFLEGGDVLYAPGAYTVVAGYSIRRALYPLEVLMQTLAGPLLGFLVRP